MAAKLGFEVVKQAMLRLLMKKGDDGIVLTLPKNEIVDYNAKITMDRLISNGIDPNSLTSPDQVLNVLDNINNQAINNARVIPGSSAEGRAITDKLFGKKGEVVEFPQKRTFKEEIEAMKKSGDIVDSDNVKISKKITDRDMFKNSSLNKRDSVTDTITYIKTLEPMDAMKEANSVIGRKGKYKNLTPEESKKILQDTEDHIFERDIPIDPEDMAKGGIAGYYTGGMVDVEPNLSDIGHGSDALMARTRLVSPDGQATTSTGLNYLLAEDNDNIRVPFGSGGSYDYGSMQHKINSVNAAYKRYLNMRKGKQKYKVIPFEIFSEEFAKENFAEGGRIGFSKGKAVVKAVDKGRRGFMKAAGATTAGIAALKTGLLGFADKAAPVVEKVAEAAPQVPAYFLNLVQKIKNLGTDVTEVLAYKDKQKVTKYKDYELTEDLVTGKQEIQRMKVMDDGSEAYYGQPLTEETYMSYKPGKGQIDETTKGKTPPDEYEEGTAYIRGDKEYAGEVVDESFKISDEVIEEGTKFEDNLSDFGKTKKADGGRIGLFLGGGLTAGKGLLRQMLNYMSKGSSSGKSGSGMLQMVNPKQFEKLLNDPSMYNKISPESGITAPELIKNMIKKTKDDRTGMIEELLSSARNIKKVDDDMLGYKNKIIEEMINKGIDREMAETFADTMSKKIMKEVGPKRATPEITEQGLLELENIQKNLINKDRKLQAQGGLTTMLGE